jgi:hypothetical protein
MRQIRTRRSHLKSVQSEGKGIEEQEKTLKKYENTMRRKGIRLNILKRNRSK